MSLEQFLASISEEDLKRLNEEYYKRQDKIPTYQYSKITFAILKELVNIKQNIDNSILDEWFNNNQKVEDKTIKMFERLIIENEPLIESYSEEDLKVNFLIPILNEVHFKSYENEFRDFYELPMRYETKNFVFNGTTDFVVSKGLIESEKPYFFIQEFKKGKQNGYPESQLLAELISGVELNKWTEIKGAYVVGSLWFFVILQKIGTNKYQYFVSKKYDGMRIDDLTIIYKNLLHVKNNIIKMVTK
ncbi:MAG: hypothetical protein U9R37_09095 [Campylobacterota bacterium]|nr:hypothetical protein [Campylobacterota bacterium]